MITSKPRSTRTTVSGDEIHFRMAETTASEANLRIGARTVGDNQPPLVIAEIGINHEGDFDKAIRMVDDAAGGGRASASSSSRTSIEDEMIPNDVIPGNADESIWDIMVALRPDRRRGAAAQGLRRGQGHDLPVHARSRGRRRCAWSDWAWRRTRSARASATTTRSIRHIASFGKPVILSTGMNDLASIAPAVEILRRAGVSVRAAALHLHVSDAVRARCAWARSPMLRASLPRRGDRAQRPLAGQLHLLRRGRAGRRVLEKHFTSDKTWPGPDVPISIDPAELRDLIEGSRAIHAALGGTKGNPGARSSRRSTSPTPACREHPGDRRRRDLHDATTSGSSARHRRDPGSRIRGAARQGRPSRHRPGRADPPGGHWLNRREAARNRLTSLPS